MNKKEIKVYLQYPWKFPDSAYYKSLMKYPPKNIRYINTNKKEQLISNKNVFYLSNKLKANIRKIVRTLNLPLINAHLTKKDKNRDLIHCAHCLSLNKTPWVADIESAGFMFLSGKPTKLGIKFIKSLILNKNCKKIMPWTENIKKDILTIFPETKDKVEVVYPAVTPLQKLKKRKYNKKIVILYVARYFWLKGGLIALEALKKINKIFDVEIIFISDAPQEVKRKYPEISFLELVPQEKLFGYYKKADIFFYPSLVDTFGFQLLEAMAFGLPIVTVNTLWTKSRNEIIKNEKNGIIFDIKQKINFYKLEKKEFIVVKKLVKNLFRLIKNKKLREKISRNNIKEIRSGKFSIKERNKKLKKIYEEAIK
ncbi:MAG: glycosyltransferase family 4 protein [Candidatus Pacearchaeota archaeon]|nr:glycosyltransferase family 4 protein [Candidatus Pacearchaeota archaeon]